ncbi:hypothetical protein ABIE65_000844 [Constrictibacter sp. MBR-5]|jgi:hypothetical protein|uniref:hypothetical protein n=1 Tax=Constrictibacter sp. MBR-5 TaxID=3156467 RepID=UPI0033908C17
MAHSLLNRATLGLAAGILAATTGGAVADRVLTDPSSGQRLLLRDNGTYTLLPPMGGGASGASTAPGNASRQSSAPGNATAGRASAGSAASNSAASATGSGSDPGASSTASRAGGTGQVAPSAPSYPDVTFDDIARATAGERVSLDGWIGNFGTGDRFLMFRDRTVSPPYVVVRMSGGVGGGPSPAGSSSMSSNGSVASSRAAEAWASDVNQRCREACAARVQGEVAPAPPGGAPEVIAHHVDVSR